MVFAIGYCISDVHWIRPEVDGIDMPWAESNVHKACPILDHNETPVIENKNFQILNPLFLFLDFLLIIFYRRF